MDLVERAFSENELLRDYTTIFLLNGKLKGKSFNKLCCCYKYKLYL